MTADAVAEEPELERFRRELTGYCYRMLGSGSEAEDAVQETFLRAWRSAAGFEGRSSLRSWLYRIATNVCIDMSREPQRRARPMELAAPSPPHESLLGPMLPEATWVTPVPDGRVEPVGGDPAEVAVHRESIRLAFVAALLRRYVDAFERYDVDALVALLHADAVMSMPPYGMWIRGAESIGAFMLEPTPSHCRGSRLVPLSADGCPAYGQYKPDPDRGGRSPWALQVLEVADGRIWGFHCFLDTVRLFDAFGLPDRLPA